MAAKGQGGSSSEMKKRKRPSSAPEAEALKSKTNKRVKSEGGGKKKEGVVKSPSTLANKGGPKKPFKSSKQQSPHKGGNKPQFGKAEADGDKKVPKTKREARIQAKELAESRKKKRKPHYNLEQELALLWEKMRKRNITKEDRSKFISEALQKMKGKIPEIASSHVSSRVLQTCVKYCSEAERNAVFEELRPHFLTLSRSTYAVHLVKKMLDSASKKQLAEFVSLLHGHVASLLRHMVGSIVVEHAYLLGNAAQKQALVVELYSTELQLFKDMGSVKETRLADVISKLSLQKASVLQHMSRVLQPILEKGIVDHSIIHKALLEYLSIADKTSSADIIQQLSGPLLVRMIHTKEGSRIAMLCIKHGSAKERKKIIKGMKGHVAKIARDQYGSMVIILSQIREISSELLRNDIQLVLVCILSIVDDTKLVSKAVVRELQVILKELAEAKNGRRPLLQLLHPNCSRYLSADDLASLNLSVPSLCTKGALEVNSDQEKEAIPTEVGTDQEEENTENDTSVNPDEDVDSNKGGRKDPLLRRQELLVNSGLAESLIDTCIENAGELLVSNFGKDIVYEVAVGGADGILIPSLKEKLDALHEAIASLVAQPKSEEEHLLENFHSSRTIRKLILDSPAFASTLWKKAIKGNSKTWAQGHSAKVVSAFLETSDSTVRELVKKELQPLVDGGQLKLPETKTVTK